MSAEAEKKFNDFDWSANSQWQSFLGNFYPVPSGAKLDRVKRKWFKKNVDSEIETEVAGAQESQESGAYQAPQESSGPSHRNTGQESSNSSSNNQNQDQQNQAQGNSGPSSSGGFLSKIGNLFGGVFSKIFGLIYGVVKPMKDQFYYAEGVLKIAFIVCAILVQGYATKIAFMACLMGFFRQTGLPQWNPDYGKKALENEFLQNLFYMIPFAFFPGQQSMIFFMPLAIHFWIGIAEFINLKLPAINAKIAKYVDFTRQNRRSLMHLKCKMEIYQFGFLILFMFIGGGSNLILLIFYGNFLKTKWMINSLTKTAFSEINYWIEGKINAAWCPSFVKFIINKIRDLCAYMVKM